MSSEVVLTIILALIAAIPGVYATLNQKRKNAADVAEKYEAMATKQAAQIDELRERMAERDRERNNVEADLRERVHLLEEEVQETYECVCILMNQLKENGITPKCMPKPRKKQTAGATQ